jgi:hypothetical protein
LFIGAVGEGCFRAVIGCPVPLGVSGFCRAGYEKAPAAAGAFSYPALQNPETPRGTGQPITARKHPSPTAPINKGEFLRPEIDRKKLSFLRSFFYSYFIIFASNSKKNNPKSNP